MPKTLRATWAQRSGSGGVLELANLRPWVSVGCQSAAVPLWEGEQPGLWWLR